MKKKAVKKVVKPLPKKFRGADVVRGLGMKLEAFDDLVDKKALDVFDATKDTWLVLEDRAIEAASHGSCEPRCFQKKEDALRYARAMACGNVDHRVLRVTDQVLVVGTDNEL